MQRLTQGQYFFSFVNFLHSPRNTLPHDSVSCLTDRFHGALHLCDDFIGVTGMQYSHFSLHNAQLMLSCPEVMSPAWVAQW